MKIRFAAVLGLTLALVAKCSSQSAGFRVSTIVPASQNGVRFSRVQSP